MNCVRERRAARAEHFSGTDPMNQSLGMAVCFAVGLAGTIFIRSGARTPHRVERPDAIATAVPGLAQTGDDVPQRLTEPYYLSDKRQALERKLRTPIACDFQQAPLADVLKVLENQCGVRIRVDDDLSADDSKIDLQVHVTYVRAETTLKAALRKIIPPHKLDFAIDFDDELRVTERRFARQHNEIRVYPAADFVAQRSHAGDPECRELIELIHDTYPYRWEQEGGAGRISFDRQSQCLVIALTADEHDAIEDFLAVLRQVRGQIPQLLRTAGGPSEAKIRRALETYTQAESDVVLLETELRQTEGIDPPRVQRWHNFGFESRESAPTPTRPPSDLTGLPDAKMSLVGEAHELSKRALRLALLYEQSIGRAEKKRWVRFNTPASTPSTNSSTSNSNP
jgi:hypothetical protein